MKKICFFFLRLLFFSNILLSSLSWNTAVKLGLVLLAATWISWINYKNEYIGFLLLCLQLWPIYRYYFGRYLSKLVGIVVLPYSQGLSTCYSNRLHDFSAIILGCYDVYVTSFFPPTE